MPDLFQVLLFYLVAWAIIYIVGKALNAEKRGIIVQPFFLMLKTSFLNQRLGFISRKRERAWRIIWNLGVILAFGQMAFIVYFLSQNLLELVYRTPKATGMVLLLPGVTVSLDTLPYILAALAVVLLSHELAHAIASLTDDVPLKSAGLFFAVIFPGGFVELDEEKLERSSLSTKLRVYSSGSSANIAVWLLVTLLFVNFAVTVSPLYTGPSGILVSGVIGEMGASKADIKKWDVIYAIDNQTISDVDQLSRFMSRIKPGTTLTLETSNGYVNVETRPHPQNSTRALLGIYPFNNFEPRMSFLPRELPYHLYWTEYWMSVLLIWIAIFNTLPLNPLDGGKIIQSIVNSRSKKAAKIVRVCLDIVFLALVGLNLILSFTNFGFVRI